MSSAGVQAMERCPKCGASLRSSSAEGLCARCLVAMNLALTTAAPQDPGALYEPGTAGQPGVSAPSPAEIARAFPHLEILDCLGRGGMGVVYRARQPQLNRLVALKILAPEKEGDPAFAERFTREARALARLNHPNIVAIHDFGKAGSLYYLLMEHVDGESLRQLLQAKKIAPAEALAIVPRICEALQYAHEHGVVHRDIKPENVLLDKERHVKIADFGIAKIMGERPGPVTITSDQQVIGTPHYMAPEQIEHPNHVDHRADIYSLGVVFYEVLTGELPLGHFSLPSQKVQVDVRLDEVVMKALTKEPERRYQQACLIKTALDTISSNPRQKASLDLPQNTTSPEQPLPSFAPPGSKRLGLLFPVSLVGGLVLLLGLLVLGYEWRWVVGGDGKSTAARNHQKAPTPAELTMAAASEQPPLPPLPDIYISDLQPVRFVSGWGESGVNKSVAGNPLQLEGKTYEHGLGTHANSEAIFEIPAGVRRFVAVVGLDDEILDDEFGRGQVCFEVYGLVNEIAAVPALLGKSPVLSQKTIRTWVMDVKLDPQFKQIRLVVSDAGDDNECDHADWVDAGFVR